VADTDPKPRNESAPSLEVRYGPAGRDTLAEIVGELTPDARRARDAPSAEPTLTVGESFVEQETMAAIHAELVTEATAQHSAQGAPRVPRPSSQPRAEAAASGQPVEIFELVTFVVRGTDVSRLASERARRQFVEQALLERLPVRSIDDVDRVDASPWTEQQSVVLRVLCRVSAGHG
jgi:hypothetical protein